jgi:hypothetical protein
MDTGEGRFEMFEKEEELEELQEQYPGRGGIFKVGEILHIRGSSFRVQSIKPKGMRLKLLSRSQKEAVKEVEEDDSLWRVDKSAITK